MSLFLPRKGAPAIDWGRFKEAPSDNIVTVDIAGVQRKLDARKDNALRMHSGMFRCPGDATPAQYERIRNDAIKRWVGVMEKMGWWLRSRLQVRRSPYPSTSPEGKPEDDMAQYIVYAVFEKLHLRPQRIELPDSILRPTVLP